MAGLSGIDRIVYGVEDMAKNRQFFLDWGLSLAEESQHELIFETLDKSQIVIRHMDDSALPPAIEEGSTVREVIWGAETEADLNEFIAGIADKVTLETSDDGVLRCRDANGVSVGFQKTIRQKSDAKGTASNTIDKAYRVDEAAPVYQRATPVKIAHVVFFCDDLEAQREFYVNTLGFNITDEYSGRGLFLRSVEEGTHHNMFLLKVPGRGKGLNHLSFAVRDIYEVMGGGIYVSSKGWETQLGPGRHPISSAFFWYFFCPGGALVEYYSDEDYLTKNWQTRQHEATPDKYAEWAIVGGIDAETRRQKYREESDLPPLKK